MNRINSPISVQVTAPATKQGATFHTIKLRVTAGIDNPLNGVDVTLSSPTLGSETITFDISSVLRAAADAYVPKPDVLTCPTVLFQCCWHEEYLLQGEQKVGSEHDITPQDNIAYFGGYTDYERITNKLPTGFTRKPLTSIETVAVGDTFIAPSPSGEGWGGAITEPGPQTVHGHTLYAVPANRNRYQFRFVNGLGAMESVSVECYADEEVQYNIEQFQQTRPESMGGISHTRIAKALDIEQWKFSTGPLTRDWRQWYAHEFLMSEHVWLFCSLAPGASAQWLPVLIIPEETTPLINRQSNDLPSIDFTVKMNFQG